MSARFQTNLSAMSGYPPAFGLFRLSFGVKSRPVSLGRLAIGVAIIAVLLVVALAGRKLSDELAVADARHAADQTAQTHDGLLSSELQKYRLLPLVLADDPEVRDALSGVTGAARQLDAKLELLADRTDSAVIYVLDPHGRAVAASNWRLPTSFVGHRYDFRAYFTDALATGRAEQFAQGAVSHRPGLFLAQRVVSRHDRNIVLGVVVAKVEFGRLERTWRHQPGVTLVTDDHGVVLLTSEPEWRFRTLRPISSDILARLRDSVQFGDSPLSPLPLRNTGSIDLVDNDGQQFAAARIATSNPGWSLLHLEPLRPFDDAIDSRLREGLLAAVLAALLVIGQAFRRRERERLRREHQQLLEREVTRRTAELSAANEKLRIETAERAAADSRLRAASEDLARANRLGVIGQITTGVAHEINQPVAAIRTFAENAVCLFERGDTAQGLRNLETIVELTSRVGRITQELRGFAQASAPTLGPVSIAGAIAGAGLLLDDRIRTLRATLEIVGDHPELVVVGDRVRLEQILINLMQNALDAMRSTAAPVIQITVVSGQDDVAITVADNGPGIPSDLAPRLFTPLVTGRPEGLGLGLGIARNIARAFGGDLDLASSPLGGAAFLLTLKRSHVRNA